jgi:uncharacterized protein (TIGR00106 family)
MAIMEISTAPLGTCGTGLGHYVAAMMNVIKESGLSYTLTDMGTIIKGNVSELLDLAKKIHEAPFNIDAMRVYTTIRIDDRRDKEVKLGDKIDSVQNRL